MSRFLFAPMPFTGHVNPGLPIARELIARGHDVRWYSTPRFRRAIERTGARWIPFHHAMPLDEEHLGDLFPDRPKEGIAQMRYDIKRIFIDFIPGALRDLEEELEREPADVIVGDNGAAVCEAVHQRAGIPYAMYGMSILTMSSRDTAPFGLSLLPSHTWLGRQRNRALYWLVDRVIFRDANEYNAKIRRRLGLPPLDCSIFDFARGADVYLQSGVAAFDYPRSDMPANVRFIGASVPEPPADWHPPTWWNELEGKRVVLVTQGTINNDLDQLIRPAIRALANENVFVVVTTGSKVPEAVQIDPLPANTRVERFIPYAHLMPKVDVLLTNGGFGSIQIALAHGVPIVSIGKTEEKPEIANRVQWSGVGIGIKVRTPKESQIRDAVRRVLSESSFSARAEALRYQLAKLDPGVAGADLLEELAEEERSERCA
ncbi:MAG TPA: nucleotide disphospho-sugar-binding domain-containing protein [Thermoanaerobaculia bacterium]|nr:nucleotide disphospho-sugar-binding domain-containing protein [Thermoanaerobaculia bacterium]